MAKLYANGDVKYGDGEGNVKEFKHGDELVGLDKDTLDELVEAGAAVEEKPEEPTPDASIITANPQIPGSAEAEAELQKEVAEAENKPEEAAPAPAPKASTQKAKG